MSQLSTAESKLILPFEWREAFQNPLLREGGIPRGNFPGGPCWSAEFGPSWSNFWFQAQQTKKQLWVKFSWENFLSCNEDTSTFSLESKKNEKIEFRRRLLTFGRISLKLKRSLSAKVWTGQLRGLKKISDASMSHQSKLGLARKVSKTHIFSGWLIPLSLEALQHSLRS